MPTWDSILKEAETYQPLALFDKYVKELKESTGRTVICYMSAFSLPKPEAPPAFFSIVDQDIQGFMTCSKGVKKEGLDLIIHSPGGDYEATKRIINYLHEIYKHIRVFVPHMAMSGGTLIACAADEIYMGPYSSLGPTDPQVFIKNRYVPIGAVIQEFNRAFQEVSKDPKKVILWRERLKDVPIGLINSLETMRDNSARYLKELLQKRNCRDKDEGIIEEIVETLNSYDRHSSHGRGISLQNAQELKLNVKDLRKEPELEDKVLSVYHAGIILFQTTPVYKIIANHLGRHFLMLPPIVPPQKTQIPSPPSSPRQ
ncbi:MAG: ATP-dependent Clp protease proteolytic subunit [Candidatus Desulfofervidus auxilii]|nr:ATP-dependent Clp protease proteolytic subunit [Candidatus Desulfofervidus auxilii]